jgi:two-component system phosphate regulon sensor histidine kinase PhoR
VVLNDALRSEIIERTADQLRVESRLAVDLIGADPDAADLAGRADALADRLGGDLAVRVTIIAGDGTVLGDSDLDAEELRRVENHGGRPEVRAALAGQVGRALRRSNTLSEEMLYVAVPLDEKAPARGVVRLAVPLLEVKRAQNRVRPLILGTSILSVLFAAAFGWLAARGPARRLQGMTRAASEIAAGRLGARAHPGGNDEVAEVGRSLNRMADQLEERLTMLGRDRHQLRTMLDGMVEGVLLLDATGRIVLANPAFTGMFDALEPVEGRRPLEVARVPVLQELIDAALATTAPLSRDIDLGVERPRAINASLAAVREADHLVGAVAVFHDVTEIRRLEQVRRDFVANVSHELRTPLTAIKGYAETLLGGALEDPPRAAEFVEVIARHAERLRALIEDLLDLAAIEQGEAPIALGSVSVREVATQAESMLRPAALNKRQDLRVLAPADLPDVLADRDRLAQVLINLLDNAVKFTPAEGRIDIGAALEGKRIVITVRDTGVGIPPGEQERIFERFYRVDRSRDRREGGTGLGLAIAKHLTQAMGGTIEVESAPGAGTQFRISLAVATSHDDEAA